MAGFATSLLKEKVTPIKKALTGTRGGESDERKNFDSRTFIFDFIRGDYMKSSMYNLYIPVQDRCVVYNTLTGSLFFMDNEMKSALEANKVQEIDEKSREVLEKNGFIVNDDADELLTYNYLFARELYSPSYSSVTVFPTYACNLSCHYCYQKWPDIKKVSMSETIYKDTVEFLKKRLLEESTRALVLKIFGGEPLMNPEATEAFLGELHAWTQAHGAQFFGSITTNGTLLRGDLFERLSPHLSAVHITLDGPQELHDSIRFYANGRGTYEDIMESLSLLAKTSIRVCLRLNIHNRDYETAASLLEDLKERGFSKCPNFELDFGLVVRKDACDMRFNVEEYVTGKELIVSSSKCIEDMLKRVGWENPSNVRYFDDIRMDKAPVLCDQTKRKRYIIDALGDLYLCPSKAGDTTFKVGHIENGTAVMNRGFYDILTRSPLDFPECRVCPYLPVCGGGCAVHAKEQNGSYNTSFCGAVKSITSLRVLSYLQRFYPEKMGKR